MSLKHQQQPTHNSCMSACVAMISSQPVSEVVAQWHEKFHSKEAWLDDAMDHYRIPYFYGHPKKAELLPGFIYFLTVPSLNIVGGLHQILAAVKEGSVVEILDPAEGRDGAKHYVYRECQNSDECELISWSVDLAIPVVKWGDQ
ncbi:hypothetical protein ACHQJB_15160 [Raoultella planticola]|uniref:hypothetical protein n=1 Tax=Klebsiella/Raoultella group TaxID=2890311 RepID=UPI00287DC774|nr:hypothetical protein [Klebsiella pasteurii]MDS7913019.1 hypothetical protein [Klebsiella pasteurii]